MNISGEIHVHKTETPIADLPVLEDVSGNEELKVYDNGVAKSVTVETLLDSVKAGQGLTEEIKTALLTIARKVAYVDEHGQTYYDALYAALYPPATLMSIAATFNQGQNVVYDTDTLDSLKQYLTVTGRYDDGTTRGITEYTLIGTLTAGTSTITVSYSGKMTTFSVTVTHATVQYTVTNNLTNCTTSNSETRVNENDAYTATITANAGTELSSVTVTMGGVDITETVYSNGVISIASVTGDIVIAATAVTTIDVQSLLTANGYYYDGYADVADRNLLFGTSVDQSTTPAYAILIEADKTYTIVTVFKDDGSGTYAPVAFAGNTGGTEGISGTGAIPARNNINKISAINRATSEQLATDAYKLTWTFTATRNGYMSLGCLKNYTSYASVTVQD